jgi:glycosyltransferase involved in cell wall biosynthesis
MDHSNLIGGVAARLAGATPIVWGLHHSEHTPGVAKRSTLMTVAACAKLSRHLPANVVSCSHHGAARYIANGFEPNRMRVIPNGFDCSRFCPDPSAPAWLRAELGLPADAPLLLLAARFDPFKDHATFVAAAARIAEQVPDVRFVLCGAEIDGRNAELTAMLSKHGVAKRCYLLGPRRDVARLFAAVDLVVSSSISEAFPLVLGEAMSCGTPCVATDVGDSAHIVGELGRIVPPSDPAALGDACVAMLSMPREARAAMGAAARQSISERFDLANVTRQYERLYEAVLKGEPRPRPVIRVRQPLAAGGDADVRYA